MRRGSRSRFARPIAVMLALTACGGSARRDGAGGAANAGDASSTNGGAPGGRGGGTSARAGVPGNPDETSSGGALTTGAAGASNGAGTDGVSGASGETGGGGTGGSSSGASAGGSSAAGSSGANGGSGSGGVPNTNVIVEALDIADVWSGHPVGFYLLTHGMRQFAAFYDANRALTIAERALGATTWNFVRLPTSVGWDSHNDIVMAVSDDGQLHVAGNMHSSPLIYFRSENPLDIGSFVQRSMTGTNETSCTYPQFFRSPAGELVFMYRDGSSGNGNHIFNAYSPGTRSWRRLLGSSLVSGEGQRNAYPVGPIQGPDGFWHLVWVWRDTPDAATNHDLSYARTSDLSSWRSAAGTLLPLPITLGFSDIVDPVPPGGGMINNNTKIGFDAQNRVVVAYHKYDDNGHTQLYNARFENGGWVRYKTSNWTYRWNFGGGGTLVFEVEVEPVELQPDGTLTQNWYHVAYGGQGAFRLNSATLAAEATIPRPVPYPPDLARVVSTTPGMEVRWRKDAGRGPNGDLIYMLRWETLPSNRDQPRSSIPAPTRLRLYGFRVRN